ncbi:MAG: hypothetical protein ACXWXR_11415, partial [Candidatus Limnocylindrales bacterium]
MATIHPRTKTPVAEPATKRGPRRPSSVPAVRPSEQPDLEALRRELYAAILAEHPGADLDGVGRAFDLAVVAHEG